MHSLGVDWGILRMRLMELSRRVCSLLVWVLSSCHVSAE